jgi:oligopeptide/dipeptide ABC transporter ATP-binding protein
MMREHLDISQAEANARVVELLDTVGIPDAPRRVRDYPHQFSGGMRQRAMIAIALACNPKLLIADEPTTALDVTIQAQIIEQVKSLRDQFGMTVIWITHDLGIVAGLASRVIVMYAGYIVEHAEVADLYADPRHPYTIGLLESLPSFGESENRRLADIEGRPPDMLQEPVLCPFLPRCRFAFDRCNEEMPVLREVGEGHQVACWADVRHELQS